MTSINYFIFRKIWADYFLIGHYAPYVNPFTAMWPTGGTRYTLRKNCIEKHFLLLFCVLKKWVHSKIGQCGRPAVYMITPERLIRSSWNFYHSCISLICRSSSKMSTSCPSLSEFHWRGNIFECIPGGKAETCSIL